MPEMFKFEKSTQNYLGWLVVVLSAIYALATLGRVDFVLWIAFAVGMFLTILLWVEAGITTYFKNSGYKKITGADFLVWITAFVSGVLFINTLALIPVIRDAMPQAILNFAKGIGVSVAVIAVILGIFYAFTGKPKA